MLTKYFHYRVAHINKYDMGHIIRNHIANTLTNDSSAVIALLQFCGAIGRVRVKNQFPSRSRTFSKPYLSTS